MTLKKIKKRPPKASPSARWMCEECGMRFNDYWDFDRHAQTHRSGGPSKPSGQKKT